MIKEILIGGASCYFITLVLNDNSLFMKIKFLLLAATLLSSVSFAQRRVVTNPFFDNWFIGVGAGAQAYFGDHNRQMKFGDQLSPAYQAYLGKWFSPGLGVRVGAGGLKFYGATQNGAHGTGEVYDPSQRLQKQEIPYIHAYGDVLFNATHIFGGYRETRFWEVIPFVGLGGIKATEAPKDRELAANVGILNTFRLSNTVHLSLDLRAAALSDRFDGEIGGRNEEGFASAVIGLKVNLGKKNWDAVPEPQIIDNTDTAELDRLSSLIAELRKDNDLLRKQLENASGKTVTDVVVEKSVLAAPILVTFPINKSTVSNEARVNLQFFAEVIKQGDAKVVYNVTGYADKGTGSTKTNERLSKARSEAIRDVLVNEFGVNPAQISTEYKGGVDNMFYDDPRLSRAVITRAQ